ncbi:hypothetical protein Y032_0151g2795 [Ancylostoma ceylanicum]|uniref:Uncharacterized protein n=1 Tax=Ancylostoma ceylanicum TaxID=53326 RepID=A0A016T0W6_9BILA|nr:hypothetical protein Y032_0151g2795 [Ancylostoma ceylanicum]
MVLNKRRISKMVDQHIQNANNSWAIKTERIAAVSSGTTWSEQQHSVPKLHGFVPGRASQRVLLLDTR